MTGFSPYRGFALADRLYLVFSCVFGNYLDDNNHC